MQTFKSKVDRWLWIVIFAVAVILLRLGLHLVRLAAGSISGFAVVIVVFASAMLCLWILFATYYQVDAKTLIVRSGPFRWIIPLEEITQVNVSTSALSSPALSLERLEIHYGENKRILVSPQNPEAFLGAIGQDLTPE